MQQIMSQIRAAVDSYQLIQSGDRIAVGISGGKDSLVLLCALANMRKFLPMKYDLVAITVDPCFDNIQTDFRQVEELCRRLQIKYEIRRSQLGNIIFEQRGNDIIYYLSSPFKEEPAQMHRLFLL